MSEENIFEALTDEEKGVLLSAAIDFKAVISEIFGDEYSEEAFSKIADCVLPSLKYEMLKNALTNKYNLFVTIMSAPRQNYYGTHTGFGYEKVKAIKAIREYSQDWLGLKEAKDICDNAEVGISTRIKVKSIEDRKNLLGALLNAGVKVI